jgi:hypothetical protein
MTDVEFHQALSVAFRSAGKPVPTLGQSSICYVDVGSPAARGFIEWLETPYRPGERLLPPKLAAAQHPGILKSLPGEYKSWCAAEPPPAQVPPPPTVEDLRAREEYYERHSQQQAEWLHLLEHPEDCPHCHGTGEIELVDYPGRKFKCGCPTGTPEGHR